MVMKKVEKIKLADENRGLEKCENVLQMFKVAKIKGLAESIFELDLQEPIIVKKIDDKDYDYQVISGNRRLLAHKYITNVLKEDAENETVKNLTEKELDAKIAKFKQIECIIKTDLENEKYIAVATNLAREDISKEEKAKLVLGLLESLKNEEGQRKNVGMGTLAQRLGISKAWVDDLIKTAKEKDEDEETPPPPPAAIGFEEAETTVKDINSTLNAIRSFNSFGLEDKLKIKEKIADINKQIRLLQDFVKQEKVRIVEDAEILTEEKRIADEKALKDKADKEAKKFAKKLAKQKVATDKPINDPNAFDKVLNK